MVSNEGKRVGTIFGSWRSGAGFASEGESFGGEGGPSILGSGGDWRKGWRTAVVERRTSSGDVGEKVGQGGAEGWRGV